MIIPRGPRASAWRSGNAKSVFWNVIKHQCKDYTWNDTQTCIEEETYRFTEIVTDSWLENPLKPKESKQFLR